MGLYLFSLPISLVMIGRIYIVCLIIIIKSEVWTITYCLGLGHYTMVFAVCLSIFFWSGVMSILPLYPSSNWARQKLLNYFSTQNSTLNPYRFVTGLTLTTRIRFVSGLSVPCRGHGEINHVWSGCFGTNRIIDNWHRCLAVIWRKKKNNFSIND